VVFQLVLAAIVPGYQQEGLPVPSLKGKRLPYNCNALGCWYITLITAATLHFTGILNIGLIIDHFGEMMTWAIISGFLLGEFMSSAPLA
jgi:delta24(24(1))-sterol reductase